MSKEFHISLICINYSFQTSPIRADADIVAQAKECRALLSAKLQGPDIGAMPISPSIQESESIESLIDTAQALLPQLTELIQSSASSEDPTKLQELLMLNDSLTALAAGA